MTLTERETQSVSMEKEQGFWHEWTDDEGELIARTWIKKTGGPKYAECPVCDKIYRWMLRTCPNCEGVVLLALYTGDWRFKSL